jgi:hypothetical protein
MRVASCISIVAVPILSCPRPNTSRGPEHHEFVSDVWVGRYFRDSQWEKLRVLALWPRRLSTSHKRFAFFLQIPGGRMRSHTKEVSDEQCDSNSWEVDRLPK